MEAFLNKNHLADRVDPDNDDEIDELFEELENENLDQYREMRLQEMKKQADELKKMKESHHGTYTEVEEKDILDITTKTKYAVVHFYTSDFKRCKIIDSHLEKISKKHFRARFIRANAQACPFLVAKLQIKVLPFVIAFANGVVTERLVGFEQLGNDDNFPTSRLEKVLAKSGVITLKDPTLELKKNEEESYYGRSIRDSTRPFGSDEE